MILIQPRFMLLKRSSKIRKQDLKLLIRKFYYDKFIAIKKVVVKNNKEKHFIIIHLFSSTIYRDFV